MAEKKTALEALKPCPFCGGSGQRTDHLDEDDNIRQSNVRCKKCGFTVPLKTWNTRTALNDAPEVVTLTDAAEMFLENCPLHSVGAVRYAEELARKYPNGLKIVN